MLQHAHTNDGHRGITCDSVVVMLKLRDLLQLSVNKAATYMYILVVLLQK